MQVLTTGNPDEIIFRTNMDELNGARVAPSCGLCARCGVWTPEIKIQEAQNRASRPLRAEHALFIIYIFDSACNWNFSFVT